MEKGQETMKVLVLGGSGMLGFAVRSVLEQKDLHWTERQNARMIADNVHNLQALYMYAEEDFNIILRKINPEYVINCIGVIKPRMMEHFEASVYTNAVFPHMLARLCKNRAKLIHITTDCVFSGKQGPYKETAPHDALDEYGKTKSLGECGGAAMVLRTSIIGPELYNKHSLISWVQKQHGQVVQGYTNHLWNGVTTFELAQIFQCIMKRNMWEPGLFHIHSPIAVNKYELVQLICQRYGIQLAALNAIEAPIACDRRLATNRPSFLDDLEIPGIAYQILGLPM
jgi:dTDP-4-dehydrorhamnose reductase